MPKRKISSYKSSDTFLTYRGERMTRSQLSGMISTLNRKFKNPKYSKHMTMGEYGLARKFYLQLSKEVYGNEQSFTIKGVHDVKQLKQIEQATRRLLSSYYFNKAHYKESKEKQLSSLSKTFTGISKDRLTKLYDIFKTDIWHHLIENELLASEQIIQLIDEYGGLDGDKIEYIVNALETDEDYAARNDMDLDEALERQLISLKESIW